MDVVMEVALGCVDVWGDKNGRVEITLECIVEGWGESENGGGVDGMDKGVVGSCSDEDCGSRSGMRLWLAVESRVFWSDGWRIGRWRSGLQRGGEHGREGVMTSGDETAEILIASFLKLLLVINLGVHDPHLFVEVAVGGVD